MYLEKISQAGDIRELNGEELVALAQEIRGVSVFEKISNTGGLSRLLGQRGMCEPTMALHLVFHLPEQKIVLGRWSSGRITEHNLAHRPEGRF